jgi:hypothetical protein
VSQDITQADCNKCGWLVNHDIIAAEGEKFLEEGDDYFVDAYEMLKCRGCGSITMRHTHAYGRDPLTTVTYYPPRVARRAPEWLHYGELVPLQLRKLMLEIYTATDNDSRRLVAMGIRAALENLMIDKIGDQGSFKANLDALLNAGYLSVRQQGTLESILEAGHAAMHRDWEPTEENINTILEITESVIETVYLHEHRANALDQTVPRRGAKRSPDRKLK